MSAADLAENQLARRPAALGYLASLVMVAAATGAALAVERAVAPPNLSLVFVLPVVAAALSFGWGPAMLAAVGGAAAFNFFLIAPRYTLRVSDPANIWALALLLITAAAVSAVAAQSRRRALQAWDALGESFALQAMARAMVGAGDAQALAHACTEALARIFKAPAVVFLTEGDDLQLAAHSGGGGVTPADEDAAHWVAAARLPSRGGAYPIDGCAYDLWPVQTPKRQRAVVGVQISGREQGRPENPERVVETVASFLSVALDREANARDAVESRVAVASERMKSELLAAVSHDLKTPLSTILVTLQSLRKFGDAHDAGTREELLRSAEAETSRLSRMVANLLDMGRLEADALPVRAAATAPDVLVVNALEHAAAALAGRKVVSDIATEGGKLMVDPSLFETALANILENAGKYSHPGATIRICSGEDAASGWIEVEDEGPGFPGPVEPLFERFARGVSGDGRAPGTGLGLTIARGFIEAQGGQVRAADRQDGKGAVVRLVVPLAVRSRARA